MKDVFYHWVFHFNPYIKQWAAIPREIYNQYWDNYDLDGIIRSSKFSTLLEIIQKTEGENIEKKLNID